MICFNLSVVSLTCWVTSVFAVIASSWAWHRSFNDMGRLSISSFMVSAMKITEWLFLRKELAASGTMMVRKLDMSSWRDAYVLTALNTNCIPVLMTSIESVLPPDAKDDDKYVFYFRGLSLTRMLHKSNTRHLKLSFSRTCFWFIKYILTIICKL